MLECQKALLGVRGLRVACEGDLGGDSVKRGDTAKKSHLNLISYIGNPSGSKNVARLFCSLLQIGKVFM
jgi:hypothetical protein